MNVVITADSYLPRLGGQEMGAFRLAKYLRRRGHRVRIFTTEKHPQTAPEEGGLEVLRAPHRFDLAGRRRLRTQLADLFRDADVVHARYCYRLAALGAPVARRLGKRFVVSLHGMGLIDNPDQPWLKRWSHRRYRHRSLAGADAVIATSDEFARLAAAHADPSRIHVIPNGIDTDEFDAARPAPPDLSDRFAGQRVVLAIARLDPRKGIPYLVQAAPRVLRACPDARFVIGGWGTQEAFARSLARDLGVADRVVFEGAIPNRAVPGYLAMASAVVFPSTMESTSHACLEAMAMGRPVVASRVGGLVQLLDEGRGVLVDLFGSSDSSYSAPALLPDAAVARFADAIIGVLEHPDEARRLAEVGRAWAVAKLDWNMIVDRILETYRS
jgi:glycosyltransferase involved in cell wall biosynthesis